MSRTSRHSAAWLLALAGTFITGTALAQDAQCILAGRINTDQQWAPRMAGVELLGQDGKRVSAASRDALGSVKQVRVNSPALLAGCNGSQALTSADGEAPGKKAQVPAVSAGRTPLDVESVSYPPLKTAGGELVELRVKVPADRVVLVSR